MTNNAPMRTNTVDTVRMSWARMDNQPLTVYVQFDNWHTSEEQPKAKKRAHTVNIGMVLGTLYTEWEARTLEADPFNEVRRNSIEKNLRVFFAEYTSRLSRTVKKRLVELVAYLDNESNGDAQKAEQAIYSLTSAKGSKAPETSKMAGFIHNLHQNFEYKNSITQSEFISLLYQYGD
jgi:hypothetical protein